MKSTIAITTLLLAMSVMVFAHGTERHVMGKVTSISSNSITVETTSQQSVTVEVNDQTKFEKSGTAATLKDFQVGDKVVIHADPSADRLIAHEVRFGRRSEAVHGRNEGDGSQVRPQFVGRK